jgi:hypothetical protein
VDGVVCGTHELPIPWEAAPIHTADVDPDVRVVMGAQSSCWTAVLLRFRSPPTPRTRPSIEELGGVVKMFDARAAVAYVPVRNLALLSAFEEIGAIEPPERLLAP